MQTHLWQSGKYGYHTYRIPALVVTNGTWHQSVLGSLRLVEKWKPKGAYLVHCSGYKDRDHPDDPVNGPMTLDP